MAADSAPPTDLPRPGKTFVEAVGRDGRDTRLELDYSITETIVSTRRKPRWPVRTLFHTVDLSRSARTFWSETRLSAEDAARVAFADERPEQAVAFHAEPLPELLPTTAWVQVPEALLDDPAGLEHFFNYRVVIRLATAENRALTAGPGGLFNIPEIDTVRDKAGYASALYAACDEIEEMGCTADGAVFNPHDYWLLAGTTNVIGVLEDHGLRIARTRLVPRGFAMVGDFGHGARLLDAGRSTVAFEEPPPGTFVGPGLPLKAEIHERILMHLPATFYRVRLYG